LPSQAYCHYCCLFETDS